MYIIKFPEKAGFPREGIILEWAITEGKPVKRGDLLFKVENSGGIVEIEASIEGMVRKKLVERGMSVNSGDCLAIIGQINEDINEVLTKIKPASLAMPAISSPKTEAIPVQDKVIEAKKEVVMTSQQSAGNPDNVIPILMPQAGQSMEEGTILSWKVKEGDRVEVGQVIMEIETDKATMEVEATDAGRIGRILHHEGDIVGVKKPVAFIAGSDADIDTYLSGGSAEGAAAKSVPAPTPGNELARTAVSTSTPSPAAAPTAPLALVPERTVIPILMPQAGQSMEEGTILSWKVKEGDRIQFGQVIMEIETDKATMEVEAVNAGRVAKIVAAEGTIVPVKTPVAFLAEEGVDVGGYAASIPTAPAVSAEAVTAVEPAGRRDARDGMAAATAASESGRVKASPAARKAAEGKGIDLVAIGAGSGPGGRILSTDVQAAQAVPAETQAHPMSKMRRAIANNLLYSKQNIPHFYAKVTIDAGALFTIYRKMKEQFKCSVNDFITAACAKAIRQYPVFRSQYKDAQIAENPAVNIGIAVGTENGLTVPVVLNADRMNLEQLAAKTRQVVELARGGKLEGMGHGVFTITNLGMFGVEEFSAIINPPESAILAVGAIREGVAVENGQMRPTRLMTVTLSVDHRVIDGAMAAQFLQTLKQLLEKPEQLL